MAPLSRTCCGFLKLQLTCKVGTPRVFLRPGLNFGLNHLYSYPVVQVRESLFNGMIIPVKLLAQTLSAKANET